MDIGPEHIAQVLLGLGAQYGTVKLFDKAVRDWKNSPPDPKKSFKKLAAMLAHKKAKTPNEKKLYEKAAKLYEDMSKKAQNKKKITKNRVLTKRKQKGLSKDLVTTAKTKCEKLEKDIRKSDTKKIFAARKAELNKEKKKGDFLKKRSHSEKVDKKANFLSKNRNLEKEKLDEQGNKLDKEKKNFLSTNRNNKLTKNKKTKYKNNDKSRDLSK